MDLEKFPASNIRQLAKKMEISKATAGHIKQVAGDSQAAQINLMRHQKSHQENTRRENLLSNQNNQVTRMLFMRLPKH